MLSAYCPECGKNNLYSFNKPKNCRFCAAELSFGHILVKENEDSEENPKIYKETSSIKTRKAKKYSRRASEENDDENEEEFTDDREIPTISKASIQVIGENPYAGVKFENVITQTPSSERVSRPSSNIKIDVNQIIKEQFKKTNIDLDSE